VQAQVPLQLLLALDAPTPVSHWANILIMRKAYRVLPCRAECARCKHAYCCGFKSRGRRRVVSPAACSLFVPLPISLARRANRAPAGAGPLWSPHTPPRPAPEETHK